MAQTYLVEDGKRLIASLLTDEFPMTRAFWYYFAESEEWRLVIESVLVANAGPIAAYTRIESVIERIEPSLSLSLSDISVLASARQLLEDLRPARPGNSEGPAQVLDSPEVTGALVSGAYIYYVDNIARHATTRVSTT
jgi:hypothetical protein